MITEWLILSTLAIGVAQAQSQITAKAERVLRKHGVRFEATSLYHLFLDDPKTPKERAAIGKGNRYAVIDDSLKLGRENLKYFRDLPNLKEIVFGDDFPDEWCKELEPLIQLEAMMTLGNFNFGKGLSDQAIASFAKLKNLQALNLGDSKVTDNGLRHIAGLTKLRWLSLGGAQNVTNRGLVHLKDLKNLEVLNLEVTRTDSRGLVHLKGLTKLREVRLANELQALANATGLKHLANMTDMRKLDARGLCAGDDDLKHLRNMTKLEDLNLCYTTVTDKGLEHLGGLTALKDLDLFGTGVTGDGLKHLRNLKNLRNLVLGFCPLEDSAAQHLRHMTHLKYLEVGDTNMTKKAIEELQRQLPQTTVR